MTTVYDVDAAKLIQAAAKELESKPEFKAPEWAMFAKTGQHNERPPMNPNWWQVRAAAVLRTVFVQGPIGVSALRKKYGGVKDMGYKPSRFVRGSGNIARKCLQQLEKAGLIKQVAKGVHKGRVITPTGQKFLNSVATKISKEK